MSALLTLCQEESADPLFYSIAEMCSVLKISSPKLEKFRSALSRSGYTVSQSHTCDNSIKTNAPSKVIWDILRVWAKDPLNASSRKPNSIRDCILSHEVTTPVDFTPIEGGIMRMNARSSGIARFLPNPTSYWGPKRRATGKESTNKE